MHLDLNRNLILDLICVMLIRDQLRLNSMVCVFVFACVCMCVCKYVYMCVFMYVCVRVFMYVCVGWDLDCGHYVSSV
jgi:hypothetical protein